MKRSLAALGLLALLTVPALSDDPPREPPIDGKAYGAPGPVTNPPQGYGPVQQIQAVAHFGCTTDKSCSITCTTGNATKTFQNLEWALVYKYPNSTKLWLYAAGGPNEQYL